MCGLAGWIARSTDRPAPDVLTAMTDAIAHRGPDGSGRFDALTRDGGHAVALGHRRLAIIDLSTGDQPMQDADGRLTVVFNGEIYNFQALRTELAAAGARFRTQSDTEVLLHGWRHWGVDMVRRLGGMFVFALWDAGSETLFLARDRFGKKPLFLHQTAARLAFASEIKALLRLPDLAPAIDDAAVWTYLKYRYVPGPSTLFKDIVKLPPGSYGLWQGGRFRSERYWTPPDAWPRLAGPAPVDPPSEFIALLDDAVRLRMIADVPYGAFLSGGIDSSAVVALMRRHAEKVKTFSVGFAPPGISELDHAQAVATAFQTEHHPLQVEPRHLMDELPKLIAFRDAPVAEPSDIPIYLLALEAGKSVKMVLTGEGSDEILAGYPKHDADRHAVLYQRLVPEPLHDHLVMPLVKALPFAFRRIKTAATSLGSRDMRERWPRWFGALDNAERRALIALPDPGGDVGADLPFSDVPGNSALRRQLYFDQTSWLPDNLLERGDRMTMAASIEARMPFLDHRLAVYASSLGDDWRLRHGTGKWLLREGLRQLLPAAILNRPKVGFRVPVAEWFRAEMRDYLHDHLTGPASLSRDYYRRPALDRILAEHGKGRQNHEKLLWTLLTLELFRRYAARA